ncbi:MAG: hypothetical protein OEY44_02530 [Candidatus Peregrinibacteria bacterium]|nr:hypothetical protein [Candidatus Peregrinibacteria bacterium]
MKAIKRLIIGLASLALVVVLPPQANADICNPNEIDSQYKRIYCGMKLYDNEGADEELIEILATQFNLDEEVVGAILSDKICVLVSDFAKNEGNKLEKVPSAIRATCLNETATTERKLAGWDLLSEIKNAYEREKLIREQTQQLEFKFKVSEQYWDGKIGSPLDPLAGGLDAPFDLIVDLNLIEKVLFGSRAEWYNDVFFFPVEDEDEDNDLEPLTAPSGEGEGEGAEADKAGQDKAITGEGEAGADENCVPTDHPDAAEGLFDSAGVGDTDLMCIDPEAVYFRQPGQETDEGAQDDGCPEGTVPRRPGSKDETRQRPSDVGQPLEYPGPYIGGTLKRFPASNRPLCGPGTSPLMITIAGVEHIAKDSDDNPICLPTEFCADPDDVRTFLAGTAFPFPIGQITAANWQDLPEDNEVRQALEAIEAIFCVNVVTRNRPLSPYEQIEGCVDCHIMAMVDALEEALQTNVTPLSNSTSAFAISSRYGPNYSFNLYTAMKSKLKYKESTTPATAIEGIHRVFEEAREDAIKPDTSIISPNPPLEGLQRDQEEIQEEEEKILKAVENYKISTGAFSDQEVGGRIIPLMIQMKNSFENIQSQWHALVESTGLNEKDQCQ